MSRLQIILGITILVLLLLVINMVRKKKIDLRYALSWLLLGLALLVIDIFPGILTWLTGLLGIELASNMVFLVGLILLFTLVYSISVAVSGLSNKVKRLTQEVALLQDELEKTKKEKKA